MNVGKAEEDLDPMRILERNRQRVVALRAAIAELEKRGMLSKAYSREVLPPMEGIISGGGVDRSSFLDDSTVYAGASTLDGSAGDGVGFLPPIHPHGNGVPEEV